MKFILLPVLISLLFAQTFSKWMVVLEYQLNKEFISKNLCINKAKPILKCKGKCQMMQKLAEEEEQQSSKNTTRLKVQEQVFIDQINRPLLPTPAIAGTSYNGSPAVANINTFSPSVFHPPAIA